MEHASTMVVSIITVMYFIYALQIIIQLDGRKLKRREATAILPLPIVFVFCGLAGYGSTLLPNTHIIHMLREGIHWVLVIPTAWLIVTNQARTVSNIITNDREEDE